MNGISGDYFAGIDEAHLLIMLLLHQHKQFLGNVNSNSTYVETLPTDGVAPSGAVLRSLPMELKLPLILLNVRLYKTIIEDGAVLNIDDTDGHRLGILEGTGTLKITSNGSNDTITYR